MAVAQGGGVGGVLGLGGGGGGEWITFPVHKVNVSNSRATEGIKRQAHPLHNGC